MEDIQIRYGIGYGNLNYRDIIKARFTLTSLSPKDEEYYEFQSLLYKLIQDKIKEKMKLKS